jgi:hypothetical protein
MYDDVIDETSRDWCVSELNSSTIIRCSKHVDQLQCGGFISSSFQDRTDDRRDLEVQKTLPIERTFSLCMIGCQFRLRTTGRHPLLFAGIILDFKLLLPLLLAGEIHHNVVGLLSTPTTPLRVALANLSRNWQAI